MKFLLVDYSFVYFEKMMRLTVPAKRSGKFVQMINEIEKKEYLALSPRELSVYHANIVERFCSLNNIAGQYNAKKDFFYINDPEWSVAGGGMFEIDDAKKFLRLYGASTAYGSSSMSGLSCKLGSSGKLEGYYIIID